MKRKYTTAWKDIEWKEIMRELFALQCSISIASQQNNIKEVHRLQKLLVKSKAAKLWAVHQVTELNKGKASAGPDGKANLTDKKKMWMAERLHVNHLPSAPRISLIPKPGRSEKRRISVPNMIDRAHQALIVLALEPQWEHRFPNTMFGFRKGRGTRDAITYLINTLRVKDYSRPDLAHRYVLDADIRSMFDNIDQTRLLAELDCTGSVREAIKRILKVGPLIIESEDANDTSGRRTGTPQGGPLSPLLANIVLARMADRIEEVHKVNFKNNVRPPISAFYADDLVVHSRHREVIVLCKQTIETYLYDWGLSLHPKKTSIRHTEQRGDNDTPGFDFLGVHFQHVWKQTPRKELEPYLLATPCKGSVKSFYQKCVDRINKCQVNKKNRGKRRHLKQTKAGYKDEIELMIIHLNRAIRGWGNYYSCTNAKRTFNNIDHMLHKKLHRWASKKFKNKTKAWLKENMFSGVETDSNGNPLKRLDGKLRQRGWAFKSPFISRTERHNTLHRMSDLQVKTYTMIQFGRNYFSMDWAYWGARSSSYPGTPKGINRAALKRQKGKCPHCGEYLHVGSRVISITTSKVNTLIHEHCEASVKS